jgi:hypothetical protein
MGRSSTLDIIEATLGYVFAQCVGIAVAIGGAVYVLWISLYSKPPVTLAVATVMGVSWLLATVVQFACVWRMARAPDVEGVPRAISIAMTQRNWPAFLRPLISAFWVAEFCLIVMVAHHIAGGYEWTNPTATQLSFGNALNAFVIFMASYASNTFLLCALATLVPNLPFLTRAWSWRWSFDIAIAVGVTIWARA